MKPTLPDRPIWAAGAVVLRGAGKRREVVLVHRPLYDDWVIPKGKAEPGELLVRTAVREVSEESAVVIRLGAPLEPIRYPINSGTKIVMHWVGVPQRVRKHKPDDEVDDVAWVRVDEALKRISYADERTVLEEAMSLPETTPFIIVRHAKAVRHDEWPKDDAKRPLDHRGRKQLKYLNQILRAYDARSLIASSATRCQQTLATYAKREELTVKPVSLLSEEIGGANPAGVKRYMRGLAEKTVRTRVPTVVCGHRPVLPAMLDALGLDERPLSTAACAIAHLDHQGKVVRAEWHESLRVKGK
ncbi:MAG: NUDIX hydrolase [Propionibacteriaceae bacterium]|jgi:8-oxo-dGTP diphosphatase|nr:NUDIX hydrolase [Propionibacteriaceae bacterium]